MSSKEEYTVNEVASILQTNPETVRKWIKERKLAAIQGNSKKEGMRINESALESFLSKYPKYTTQAYITATLAILTGGISIPASIIFNAQKRARENFQNDLIGNSRIKSSDIIRLLEAEITQEEEAIAEKIKSLESLEKEIHDKNERIAHIKEMICDLEKEQNTQNSKKDLTVHAVSASKDIPSMGRKHIKKSDASKKDQE